MDLKVKMTLLDQTAEGRIKCSMGRAWEGVAYRIPRDMLSASTGFIDLNWCGIYFLFGIINDKPAVYVGQASTRKNSKGIIGRLQEHNKPSEGYWNECIALSSTANTLGPTELCYLENRYYRMAANAKSYKVVNANEPAMGNFTDDDRREEIDDYIEKSKMILKLLNRDFFTKASLISFNAGDRTLFCANSTGADAMGIYHADGTITVLKGSHISNTVSAGFPTNRKSSYQRRMQLIENRIIVNEVFKKDHDFTSPSSAAAVILGRSADGLIEWKLEDRSTELKTIIQG